MTTLHQVATLIRESKQRIITIEETISLLQKLGKNEMIEQLSKELEEMRADLREVCPNDPMFKEVPNLTPMKEVPNLTPLIDGKNDC